MVVQKQNEQWLEETKNIIEMGKFKKTFDTDYGAILAENIDIIKEGMDFPLSGVRLTGIDIPTIEQAGITVERLNEKKVIEVINYVLGLE